MSKKSLHNGTSLKKPHRSVSSNLNPKNIPRWRTVILAAVFAVMALALFTRLFQLQILLHSHYHELALRQRGDKVEIKLPRGNIFDRRGVVMALNIPRSYSFGVRPHQVAQRRKLAASLAKVTGSSNRYYLDRMKGKSQFVWLARQLNEAQAEKLRTIPALIEQCETKRFYPFGGVTPKALGFVDRDGVGIAGLEEIFHNRLTSHPGYEMIAEDGFGNVYGNLNGIKIDPVPGANLVTTFDNAIQEIAARSLKKAVERYRAKGGMVIVMLPRSGDVLAMHSTPGFDPNCPEKAGNGPRRIAPVVNIFEPGSTAKLIPALAALRKGMPLDRLINCENGRYRVGRHYIKDVKPHSALTFEEVIVKSSNVGVAKISQWVGKKELYRAARDLGFGYPTGITLPGEARGILSKPSKWDEYMLATVGIGQGISCSALQLAASYCAVANDGVLMKPRLLRAIEYSNDDRREIKPFALRRVMSPQFARTLTGILVKVVEEGTGWRARIPGLTLAGKTGTGQIPISKTEGYSDSLYMSSFVGFTLKELRMLCLVVLEEPQEAHFGGTVAAPVVKEIIEKSVPLLATEECFRQGPLCELEKRADRGINVPNMLTLSPEYASMVAKQEGIPCLLQ